MFAIGLNYASHAGESGFDVPKDPVVFMKHVSSFAGPDVDVHLSGDTVDWEAELVAVIGVGGRNISEAEAWDHVEGFSVGQDLSDRTVQFWGHPPQFSLGKSRSGFSPAAVVCKRHAECPFVGSVLLLTRRVNSAPCRVRAELPTFH